MKINAHLHIDEAELTERFLLASGPGGQHVNKVATAVQLRFDAAQSPSLPASVRTRLLTMRDPHVTPSGEVIITARSSRSQSRNRIDARERLAELINRAAQPPKQRRATRPPVRAKAKRLQHKKQQGQIKQLRKPPSSDD